ncbi:hypothetical protein, partial [Candidatus Bathycorpusculum sp.]|uniref:hypothetical protein n=1 Tax=Candidatus Bathycorpusculum sp. TaxID=2994959 RepID=UPI00282634DB|nr:hypothetical protein [Candidatus Termitimicrobium sp.]MCL2432206.1 hypothetical protein [Candidatus Termitimicrobium sp.]
DFAHFDDYLEAAKTRSPRYYDAKTSRSMDKTKKLKQAKHIHLVDTIIHTSCDDMKNIDLNVLVNVVRFLLRCINAET